MRPLAYAAARRRHVASLLVAMLLVASYCGIYAAAARYSLASAHSLRVASARRRHSLATLANLYILLSSLLISAARYSLARSRLRVRLTRHYVTYAIYAPHLYYLV